MIYWFLGVVIATGLLGAFWRAASPSVVKRKGRARFIGYRLFYSDQKSGERKKGVIYSRLLVSPKYGIQGKPDFIYKSSFSGRLMPVELKSAAILEENQPRYGDLLQLAAYFLILEDCFPGKPRKGFLIYSDCMFKIKNTAQIRKLALKTAEEMRLMLDSGAGEANPSFPLCKSCMCKAVCQYTVL